MLLTTSLRSGYFHKPNFICMMSILCHFLPPLLVYFLSQSEEFFQCMLFLREKFLFVSFQFKDTIVKLEYISSLFQISNTLIFVERECQLSISQMLCMNSAAECNSAPLQMNFCYSPRPNSEAIRALVIKTLFLDRYIN